jgi:predicted signal transduction protein with EAL and GGDEF domain
LVRVACGQRETAEELIADADVARYAAKAAGKNRIALFAPTTQASAQKGMSVGVDVDLDLEPAGALVADPASAP